MNGGNFLKDKYCEINYLKSLLETYPTEYKETIIKVITVVSEEVSEYLESQSSKRNIQHFTKKELAKYNGKDGNKAYIALNNIVYDVTEIGMWKKGNHFGVVAGQVLDGVIQQGHENYKEILEMLPIVGELVDNSYRVGLRKFTMEEIALFDGKDGREAYVVIEGTVYDVKESKDWSMGKHYGVSAGKDLTQYFNSCHENQKHYLKKLRIVGTIIE